MDCCISYQYRHSSTELRMTIIYSEFQKKSIVWAVLAWRVGQDRNSLRQQTEDNDLHTCQYLKRWQTELSHSFPNVIAHYPVVAGAERRVELCRGYSMEGCGDAAPRATLWSQDQPILCCLGYKCSEAVTRLCWVQYGELRWLGTP